MSNYISQRHCSKCGIEYPFTLEYFAPKKNSKTGLRTWCKSCERNRMIEYRDTHRAAISEQRHEHYLDNREQIIERVRLWRADNPDKRTANRKAEYERNRTKAITDAAVWGQNNPDKRRITCLRWNRNNPLKLKANRHRRRARKKQLLVDFTSIDWEYALDYFGGCCAVCGRPVGLWHTLAMDHWIPLNSPDCPGTVPTNMLPLCHGRGGCNNSKSDKEAKQWLIARFGKLKAKQILQQIEVFFSTVRQVK